MNFNFLDKKVRVIPKSEYPKVTSVMKPNERYDETDPKDFFDFSDGLSLSDSEKQEFIEKIMDYFNENPNQEYCNTGTGNCMVIGFNRQNEIEILVVEKYMSATVRK